MALATAWDDVPQKCGSACKNGAQRLRWGCDSDVAPTEHEQGAFNVVCWRCLGHGCHLKTIGRQRYKCSGGRVWFPRCPAFYWAEWVSDFMRSYRVFQDHGVMPVAGGLHDQSATWWMAVRLARVVEQGHQKRANEKERRRIEAAAVARRGGRR